MRRIRFTLTGALLGALLCVGAPASAQQDGGLSNLGVVQSVILTISPDALFNQSAFGQRIALANEACVFRRPFAGL